MAGCLLYCLRPQFPGAESLCGQRARRRAYRPQGALRDTRLLEGTLARKVSRLVGDAALHGSHQNAHLAVQLATSQYAAVSVAFCS